jgi:probable F420-dependent oxidoreductase
MAVRLWSWDESARGGGRDDEAFIVVRRGDKEKRMRIGLNLQNYGPLGHRAELMAAVDAADELGFDSVWVSDHILMPKSLPDPYGSIVEALSTLAFIAGRSERLRLGTSVVVLPQRNPILLAKQAATIHELSGGRFTLGVGVGWVKEEYAMLGASWHQRGRAADEFIEAMQELWTNPDPRFDGDRISFRDALFAPRPAGQLPLVVGGAGDAALRRAARYGDGWHAIHCSADAIRSAKARLDELSEGRNIEIQLRISANLSGSRRLQGLGIEGDPKSVREAIGAYEEAGVDLLIMDFATEELDDYLSQMRTFAAQVEVGSAI